MATQTKNKKNSETTNKVATLKEDKEKENMQKEIAQLKEQLQALLDKNTQEKEAPTKRERKGIKIVNLTRGALQLKGSRIHRFEKQFDSRVFSEGEVRQIYNNMPQTLAEGYAYIVDNNMVEELELEDAYNNLIDADTLKILLKKNAEDVVEIYKNANEVQQKTIVGMIEDQKLSGKPVDANILIELGNICGKNFLEIEPLE